MAPSNFVVCFLLFLLHSTLPTVRAYVEDSNHRVVDVGMISKALSDKGYDAMSLTLEMTLKALIPSNTTVTIFCPPDKAFFSLKYPQPPFTLLQYHVAPIKLDREDLESSLPLGSKVDTLLRGHPLVVTTVPDSKRASINEIKITEWDIYNDGRVIVHGVEDFFDPALQTLIYPWYDGEVMKNDDKSSISGSTDVDTKGSSEAVGLFSWVKDVMEENMIFLLLVVATASGCFLCLAYVYYGNYRHRDDGYVYVENGFTLV